MTFKRSSGILMHISSLPGKYGIGTFGKEAYSFINLLNKMGFTYWQTLPLGPADKYHSPYKSPSAFAGNPFFIDPELLAEEGLLTQEELKDNEYSHPYSAAYEWLDETRISLFRKAFSRIGDPLKQEIRAFEREQQHWLPDFALYMTLKNHFDGQDWYLWKDIGLRDHHTEALKEARKAYAEEILFYEFLQYEFTKQWNAVKCCANDHGIQIIGDMPIYVSLESADVWAHRDLFDLDPEGQPNHIAGVPPDYFCCDGQLWGNPLYNWTAMKASAYKWWINRIGRSLEIYDAVRIDHFRAFSAYWAVAGTAKTARNGKWLDGPGMDFFNAVFNAFDFKEPRIIAEDLGVMDEGVINLLQDTGLPGMRILQFGFIEDGNNHHLPHNYVENSIAYTGTHDNNTLLGFLWELPPYKRDYALKYVNYPCCGNEWQEGGPQSPSCRHFIRCLWQSCASLAILPIQDLCGFGGDTKMNCPGCADGNWSFRITRDALDTIDTAWMRSMNEIYKRIP